MRRMFVLLSLFGLLMVQGTVSPDAAEQSTAPCAESPKVVSACFVVHGRLFFANGNPSFRILRIGTKRILGVANAADDMEASEEGPRSID